MVITNSNVGMESARTYTSVRTDVKRFSTEMFKRVSAKSDVASDPYEEFRNQCINYLLRWLFGMNDDEIGKYRMALSGESSMVMRTTCTEEHYFSETEETSFSTQGVVRTADGREIDFNLSVEMSRSFEEAYTRTVENVQCVDPLVINLEGNIADVSDQKFFFDLDADGTADEISMLGKGSGFLALDLNGDGQINDGTELFGTKSGNGFADLMRYDSDHNGWIDEADDIFSKLKIMTFDEDGHVKTYSLREKGVGAMYLGSMSTDFSLNRRDNNATNAYIRRTGMFLYENGTSGSLQQVDMAKGEA